MLRWLTNRSRTGPLLSPPVPTFIKSLTFDCGDALIVATFWASVLGSNVDEESTSDKAYVDAPGWGGPNMWFNRVPEGKVAKNRVHLDLRAPSSVDEEVQRLDRARGDRRAVG